MNVTEKINRLNQIYRQFEDRIEPYQAEAVCAIGCDFCCTGTSNVDITTLEGLVIVNYLKGLGKTRRRKLQKTINANIRKKEQGRQSPCPFLLKNQSCRLYAIRPFSCRQLYSLKKCGPDQGPVVHRHAKAVAEETVFAIQTLDPTGYWGPLEYILHMLQTPAFFQTYISGGFEPARIQAFGQSHGIGINQMASQPREAGA